MEFPNLTDRQLEVLGAIAKLYLAGYKEVIDTDILYQLKKQFGYDPKHRAPLPPLLGALRKLELIERADSDYAWGFWSLTAKGLIAMGIETSEIS